MLFFAATYRTRQKAAYGVRTPLVTWIDVMVLLALRLLLGNVLGVLVSTERGPCTAALTGLLFVSDWI